MSDLTIAIYQKIHEANESRVFEHWHASSIADCPRAHFFKRIGVPPTNVPEAGKMLRWKAGHIMEGEVRPHLETLFPSIQSNVRLTSEKMDLTGEYDNYIPDLGRIIEVKSVHDRAMRMKDRQAILRDDAPYPAHEIQNHCYVLLLREAGEDPKEIEYLYITLGGLMTSYRTPIKSKLIRNVQARLKVLNDAWETGVPPDCNCREDHPLWNSLLKYCDYKGEECCSLNLLKG